jgi:hypothetical protein
MWVPNETGHERNGELTPIVTVAKDGMAPATSQTSLVALDELPQHYSGNSTSRQRIRTPIYAFRDGLYGAFGWAIRIP